MKHFCDALWVSENVIPYYEPLINPTIELERHLFWANFPIQPMELNNEGAVQVWAVKPSGQNYGFDISDKKIKHRKDQILRNLVSPELGLYILEQAQGIVRQREAKQCELF